MPTWTEIQKEYGADMAERMKECPYLKGITVTLAPNGEFDIPEHDIDIAYRWVMGKPVHPCELD